MESAAGKGDDPRPVNRKKFSETMDRIFGKKDELEFQKDKPGKKGYVDKRE